MSKIFILFFYLISALLLNAGAHLSHSSPETNDIEYEQYFQEVAFPASFEMLNADENENERFNAFGFSGLFSEIFNVKNSCRHTTIDLPDCVKQCPVPVFYTNLPPPLSA